MSWREPNQREEDQMSLACSACGAAPGEWCSTRTGNPAQLLHVNRYYADLGARRAQRVLTHEGR